jgi:hypothetical protein
VFGLPLAVLVIVVIPDHIGRYDLLLHTPVFQECEVKVTLDCIWSSITAITNPARGSPNTGV